MKFIIQAKKEAIQVHRNVAMTVAKMTTVILYTYGRNYGNLQSTDVENFKTLKFLLPSSPVLSQAKVKKIDALGGFYPNKILLHRQCAILLQELQNVGSESSWLEFTTLIKN